LLGVRPLRRDDRWEESVLGRYFHILNQPSY
jgi:hypothetical protein